MTLALPSEVYHQPLELFASPSLGLQLDKSPARHAVAQEQPVILTLAAQEHPKPLPGDHTHCLKYQKQTTSHCCWASPDCQVSCNKPPKHEKLQEHLLSQNLLCCACTSFLGTQCLFPQKIHSNKCITWNPLVAAKLIYILARHFFSLHQSVD